jgi:RNA polymerase primary sigma factor
MNSEHSSAEQPERPTTIDVSEHVGLIHTLAKRYAFATRGDRGITYDDLVQAGFCGAMRAAEKYDPTRGAPSTALWPWIRQAIQREVANRGSTVRCPVYLQHRRLMAGEAPRAEVYSLDRTVGGGDEGTTHLDMLPAPEPGHDLPSLESLIERTPALTTREVQVLRMRARDLHLIEIGAELGGLSRERIRQIEAEAVLKIREVLVREGDLDELEVPRVFAQRELKAVAQRESQRQRARRRRGEP